MERRIALVSCVRSKQATPAAAKDLYTSPLFRGLRAYAERQADAWFILSAEHGLLHPDQPIVPYERTLNAMGQSERERWAEGVRGQLTAVVPPNSEVIVLAGERYRRDLVPFLKSRGCSVTVPLDGLSFGRQLRRLKELEAAAKDSNIHEEPAARQLRPPRVAAGGGSQRRRVEEDLDRFYELVGRLSLAPNQNRPLGDYSGSSSWPHRGVYLFREQGEHRSTSPTTPRVVRVGTHAVSTGSRSRLWGRLRTHRGSRKGTGNHRGSIFRQHVGMALLARKVTGIGDLPSWGVGQSARREIRDLEADHERRVSAYLAQMRVLWVAVLDDPGPESARAYLERNAIALLSNDLSPVDPPSRGWLGLHSPRPEIRGSGLWNLKHVTDSYDPRFLDAFERVVEAARL